MAKPAVQKGMGRVRVAWRDIDEGGRTRPAIEVFIGATDGEIGLGPRQINRDGTGGMRQIPDRDDAA
jgi:hypothetical protein